jgi:IPT/TIG domain
MQTLKKISLLAVIAITVACGYSSKNYGAAAVPAISQLSPGSTTAGGNAFTLTVTGSNFAAQAVVNWNGVAQTSNTAYISANQLTVAVPASMIAASGTIQITVTNPATSGPGMYGAGGTMPATSGAMNFSIE